MKVDAAPDVILLALGGLADRADLVGKLLRDSGVNLPQHTHRQSFLVRLRVQPCLGWLVSTWGPGA